MRRSERQQGFILVVVLVALVVLSLLAGAVAVSSARAVREARAEVDAFDAELAGIGTRDTLLSLLATQRQTVGGMTVDDQVVLVAGQATAFPPEDGDGPLSTLPVGNEVKLDSTPYAGLGPVRFALQDDAGLFSINWLTSFRPQLFEFLEVPVGEWDSMEARRLDYQDADALHRLGGAEAPQYREAGLSPPSTRTIVTPLERRNIPGWRKALAPFDDAEVMRLFTAARSVVINANTATESSLQVIPGVDEATAQRIIALRRQQPFMLEHRLVQEFQLPIDEMAPIGLLAVGYGTLALWHNAGGPVSLLHWTLTPIDEGGRPWRLDYEITLPRDEVADPNLVRPAPSPLLAQPPATGE